MIKHNTVRMIPAILLGIVMVMFVLAVPAFADDDPPENTIHIQNYVNDENVDYDVLYRFEGEWAVIKDGYKLPDGPDVMGYVSNLKGSRDLTLLQLGENRTVQQSTTVAPGNYGYLTVPLKEDITYILRYSDESVITLEDPDIEGVKLSASYTDKAGKKEEIRKDGDTVPNGVFLDVTLDNGYDYPIALNVYGPDGGLMFQAVGDSHKKSDFTIPPQVVFLRGVQEDLRINADFVSEGFAPMGTTITKLTPGKKKLTVNWKEQSEQIATGYEIRCSKDKTFSSGVKTKRISDSKTIKCKLTGLKAGKKYYVQVRTYKTIDGKEYYAEWSQTRSAKVKK